jgi:hypothetical protein
MPVVFPVMPIRLGLTRNASGLTIPVMPIRLGLTRNVSGLTIPVMPAHSIGSYKECQRSYNPCDAHSIGLGLSRNASGLTAPVMPIRLGLTRNASGITVCVVRYSSMREVTIGCELNSIYVTYRK